MKLIGPRKGAFLFRVAATFIVWRHRDLGASESCSPDGRLFSSSLARKFEIAVDFFRNVSRVIPKSRAARKPVCAA
jgi:hypothetical protein